VSGRLYVNFGVKKDYIIICLGWEKLRFAYNAVLIITTVSLCTLFELWTRLHKDFFIMGLLIMAVAANILFCAGHVAECYAFHRKLRSIHIRRCLFLGGTIFAMFLTATVLWDIAYAPTSFVR